MKKVLAIGLLLFSPSLLLAQNTGATRVSSVNTSTQGGGASGATVVGTTSVCSVGSSGEADSVCLGTSTVTYEGATADTSETTLTVTDPTADRTITFPNNTGTVGLLQVTQTWSGTNTFSGSLIASAQNISTVDDVGYSVGQNSSAYGLLTHRTTLTPDGEVFATGSQGNFLQILERSDVAFDFEAARCGTSACTNPSLIIRSPDQVTSEWFQADVTTAGLSQLTSNDNMLVQSGFGGTTTAKALTDSTETAVVQISVAQGVVTGGQIVWTVIADDGSDFQALSGSTTFQAVNPAGTEVCTVETVGGASEAVSSGTLTNTVTCITGLTDVVQIGFNATSSLLETTLAAYYTVILNGPGTVTPQ